MIGVDTNVLVRFLVDDDPRQNESAREFMSARHFDDPAFVSAVTLAETVWVLHRRLGFAISSVVAILRDLLASAGLIIEYADELGRIIEDDAASGIDIADHLISWSGLAAGCTHTVTFDRRATKSVTGMELLG
ncbi:MAG: type II toxin-antitoxin system VapC family toxin [Pseudaminobacter sp.]|nr:type II toxin-antitoxin system VapC family toxin [Pseudaminobacter sp.]